MKNRHIYQLLAVVTLFAFITPLLHAQDAAAQRISPPRNWGLAFTRYSQFREDYDSLPLVVSGIRGGKLSPNEKFKIEVTSLENRTNKPISSVEFSWYLFDNTDLNHLFDSGKTTLVDLTAAPKDPQKLQLFVLNIEDIPFLQTNPRGTFTLEVGIAKIVYTDGLTWESAISPGRFVQEKAIKY